MERSTDSASPVLPEVTAAVRDLIAMMQQAGLTKVDIVAGDVSIRLRGPRRSHRGAIAPAAEPFPPPPEEPTAVPDGHTITAPMIGTFYASPEPDKPPYVRVGDRVASGETIGIIETMKIMNEITADRSGVVAAILVVNGQAVEYGSPLMRLTVEAAP